MRDARALLKSWSVARSARAVLECWCMVNNAGAVSGVEGILGTERVNVPFGLCWGTMDYGDGIFVMTLVHRIFVIN